MRLKELGATGVFIPEVGTGTWGYHAGAAPLRRAVEAGAWFIDTAESYGTEPVVGEAIAGIRHQAFVATKVSPENFRSADLRKSVEGSLRRLRIETIDLLQLHRPNRSIPIAETVGAMADLIDAGKVRFAGVSNFSVAELREAQRAFGNGTIVSHQVRYSLIDRTIEKEMLAFCQASRITIIAYSPLARGFGRIRDCDPHGVLDEIARAAGRSPAQVALNWCIAKDGVVAIPGSNSVEHILDNCAASEWRLSADQVSMLDAKILYRRRTAFDALVRRFMPGSFHRAAAQIIHGLPRGLRRRIM